MTAIDAAFWALGLIALAAGYRVFRTDSMVRASFLLLASFVAVGAIMLLLAAEYLGFATIFMMAVEMTVMALFMVMFMMNPAGLNPMNMVHQPRLAAAAGIAAFAGLAVIPLLTDFPDRPADRQADPIAALGNELLGGSMLIFESAGVTLLATMIGAVILSSRSGRYGPSDHGSVPPGLEPGGEPAGRRPKSEQRDHSDGGGHAS
ncbi:MAG: NADH-quinone oxidoreductase subunit J [Gammaproteobacteria bacterium]|nr:NADH-quinone oxidoreductase subunit J [Gammaproteobacteria bacterium]